jgi:CDP-paratose 2-epimerase
MKLLITGICGFAGSVIAATFQASKEGVSIWGLDNLMRPGSEMNRLKLKRAGIQVIHGDIRQPSDLETLPAVDWVIDAAANPSVLAGVDGRTSSRQLIEHNLHGTLNILEYCRREKAGLILLSSSRVYSIAALNAVPVKLRGARFDFDESAACPAGVTRSGVQEGFSTSSPISLYGSTKLASETMALEYSEAFGFPLWINRCGILTGAGQMGTAEQGVFSYWLHAHAGRLPLRFIGYDGTGHQVRDAFHPQDLALLLEAQMQYSGKPESRLFNVGGGSENSLSLAELTAWCDDRFGAHSVAPDPSPRRFDIPWLVMDSSRAGKLFGWAPRKPLMQNLEEIAVHAENNPNWLESTA